MCLRAMSIAVLLAMSTASALAQPCAPTTKGVVVCGRGEAAVTIHAGSHSPSGKLAIGWRRAKDAPQSELPDAEYVEQQIVRLADGQVLGSVIGRAWNDGEMKANRIELRVVWSPDERMLLLADIGRFSLVALAIYSVDAAAGTSKELLLSAALKAATDPKLLARVGKKQFEQYELQLREDPATFLSSAGRVTMPLEFHIPKQDRRHLLTAKFSVRLQQGRLAHSPIDVRMK